MFNLGSSSQNILEFFAFIETFKLSSIIIVRTISLMSLVFEISIWVLFSVFLQLKINKNRSIEIIYLIVHGLKIFENVSLVLVSCELRNFIFSVKDKNSCETWTWIYHKIRNLAKHLLAAGPFYFINLSSRILRK